MKLVLSFYTSEIMFLQNAKHTIQENFGSPFTGNIYVKDVRYKLVKYNCKMKLSRSKIA